LRLAGDENIRKTSFAGAEVRGVLESVNGSQRVSQGSGCMSYASLGVDRKGARVLGVAQGAFVAELVDGNPYVRRDI